MPVKFFDYYCIPRVRNRHSKKIQWPRISRHNQNLTFKNDRYGFRSQSPLWDPEFETHGCHAGAALRAWGGGGGQTLFFNLEAPYMSADDSKEEDWARSRGVASFLLKLGGFARAKKSPGLPWEAKPPESIDSCRFIWQLKNAVGVNYPGGLSSWSPPKSSKLCERML